MVVIASPSKATVVTARITPIVKALYLLSNIPSFFQASFTPLYYCHDISCLSNYYIKNYVASFKLTTTLIDLNIVAATIIFIKKLTVNFKFMGKSHWDKEKPPILAASFYR